MRVATPDFPALAARDELDRRAVRDGDAQPDDASGFLAPVAGAFLFLPQRCDTRFLVGLQAQVVGEVGTICCVPYLADQGFLGWCELAQAAQFAPDGHGRRAEEIELVEAPMTCPCDGARRGVDGDLSVFEV